MFVRSGSLVIFLTLFITNESIKPSKHASVLEEISYPNYNLNKILNVRRRDVNIAPAAQSDVGDVVNQPAKVKNAGDLPTLQSSTKNSNISITAGSKVFKDELNAKFNATTANKNKTEVKHPTVISKSLNSTNETLPSSKPTSQLDINNPGVLKRGLIVFGGFTILAVTYFIFYRKKKNNIMTNTFSNSDTDQFRYGVLHSDDRRDNLELSRIPLTIDSDDDDDEDLEIFDLGQKKKSLSYVNLQTNDEDLVLNTTSSRDTDATILLDIDDTKGEQLINWTSDYK